MCCQLLTVSENRIRVLDNFDRVNDPRSITISVILHEANYNIIYQRIFEEDRNLFEDLGEANPVNQSYSHTLIGIRSVELLSSDPDQENSTLEYYKPGD